MGRREDEPTYVPANVLKVMISTDNHLGYLEKDPIRGDDSFRTFEEFLTLAKANSADIVLLGGDLFHDNKPSRRTTLRTIQILRRFCLGPRPVSVLVRSCQANVNYMDPNFAVGLPIFVIHGNHDDPTGSAGTDALSAIDLLAASNLVTYFGKSYQAQRITIEPILLQKGMTKLALYGLGNIRDERLYNTWYTEKKVQWRRPAATDAHDDPWFNLFVLHQNRAVRGTAKAISDSMLPDWLDLVIWGHEHESIPDTTLSLPPVAQPGSTVATSLCQGEARPKHCALLEVYKGSSKLRWVPLQSVREFVFDSLMLSSVQKSQERRGLIGDEANEDEEIVIHPGDEKSVWKYLAKKANEMAQTGQKRFDSKRAAWANGRGPSIPRKGVLYPEKDYYVDILEDKLRLPLVRLRVEYSGGYEPLSISRFAQEFVGRVASPGELLLFFRKRVISTGRKRFLAGRLAGGERRVPGSDQVADPLDSLDDTEDGPLDEDAHNEEDDTRSMDVPRLVQFYLYSGGKEKVKGVQGLKFLELDALNGAVETFVNKAETKAIREYVSGYLDKQQQQTIAKQKAQGKLMTEEDIRRECAKAAYSAAERVFRTNKEDRMAMEENQNEKTNSKDIPPKGNREEGAAYGAKEDRESGKDKEVSDSEELARSVAKAASASLASIQEVIARVPSLAPKDSDDDVNNSDDEEEEEEVLPKKTRGRRPPAKPRAPAKRKTTASSRKKASEEELLDDDEEEYNPSVRKRKAPIRSSASARNVRARTSKPRSAQPKGRFFSRRPDRRGSSPAIVLDSDDEGDNAM